MVSGKIPACVYVQQACQRALDDRERWKGRKAPYYWDKTEAARPCAFIELLPHVEGVWATPNITLEPWQIFLLTQLFGWRSRGTGLRRFTDGYIEVARKNAKSTLSSGIGLFALGAEGELGPQVKCAATTGDQARIVWGVAQRMIEASPVLRDAGYVPHANSITCTHSLGDMKPINAKASTQDGLNPSCIILDELHAHQTRALFDVLKSARGARRNPLSLAITTAGWNHTGVCMEQRQLVEKVLQRTVEAEHYFGIIYTIDEGDDPFDPKVWPKANPNLGVSVFPEQLASYANEARISPQSEAEFKTKRCNMWINAAVSWLNIAQWDACRNDDVQLEDFEGLDCWLGADLAEKGDNCAIALVFPGPTKVHVFARYYLPEAEVKKAGDRAQAPYATWAKQGWIKLTDGNATDYNFIEQDIRELADRFHIRTMTFDKWGSAQITTSLFNDGYPAGTMAKNVGNISNGAKDFEQAVKTGRVCQNGNPVLRWNVSNTCVTRRVDGSILPKKESEHSPGKIDGVDALMNAWARWLEDEAEGESYWASGELALV